MGVLFFIQQGQQPHGFGGQAGFLADFLNGYFKRGVAHVGPAPGQRGHRFPSIFSCTSSAAQSSAAGEGVGERLTFLPSDVA